MSQEPSAVRMSIDCLPAEVLVQVLENCFDTSFEPFSLTCATFCAVSRSLLPRHLDYQKRYNRLFLDRKSPRWPAIRHPSDALSAIEHDAPIWSYTRHVALNMLYNEDDPLSMYDSDDTESSHISSTSERFDEDNELNLRQLSVALKLMPSLMSVTFLQLAARSHWLHDFNELCCDPTVLPLLSSLEITGEDFESLGWLDFDNLNFARHQRKLRLLRVNSIRLQKDLRLSPPPDRPNNAIEVFQASHFSDASDIADEAEDDWRWCLYGMAALRIFEYHASSGDSTHVLSPIPALMSVAQHTLEVVVLVLHDPFASTRLRCRGFGSELTLTEFTALQTVVLDMRSFHVATPSSKVERLVDHLPQTLRNLVLRVYSEEYHHLASMFDGFCKESFPKLERITLLHDDNDSGDIQRELCKGKGFDFTVGPANGRFELNKVYVEPGNGWSRDAYGLPL